MLKDFFISKFIKCDKLLKKNGNGSLIFWHLESEISQHLSFDVQNQLILYFDSIKDISS